MKMSYLYFLVILFSLIACDQNNPLNAKFWQDPTSERIPLSAEESEPPENLPAPEVHPQTKHTYIVHLFTLSSANLGEISGLATIDVNDTDVITSLNLSEVPQSLMIGQRSLTHQTCAEVASSYPPPALVTMSTEFKNTSSVDYASVESLIRELNQIDGRNGDAVDLEGKTFVVKAYVENFNTPSPTKGEFIPVACGTITRE